MRIFKRSCIYTLEQDNVTFSDPKPTKVQLVKVKGDKFTVLVAFTSKLAPDVNILLSYGMLRKIRIFHIYSYSDGIYVCSCSGILENHSYGTLTGISLFLFPELTRLNQPAKRGLAKTFVCGSVRLICPIYKSRTSTFYSFCDII